METRYKQLEEALLKETDLLIEQAESQAEKIIFGWFKTNILKKYKEAFDEELKQGKIHKENVDKAIDFCFDDVCAKYRLLSGLSDDQKENDIDLAKEQLPTIRQLIYNILESRSVEIVY